MLLIDLKVIHLKRRTKSVCGGSWDDLDFARQQGIKITRTFLIITLTITVTVFSKVFSKSVRTFTDVTKIKTLVLRHMEYYRRNY
jgi:hypothetical protein